jgi:alpha-L-rhamnosidase
MNLELADGTGASVVSDETWKVSRSPITACDLCAGEIYDARLEAPGWDSPGYDDATWDSARGVTPPEGKLVSQSLPPITVVDTIPPVGISQPEPDIYIYDFGQQLSGWAKLRVRGPRGTEVKLRFAQEVYDSGHLDDRAKSGGSPSSVVSAQTDTYLLKGNGEEVWEPRFTLHGFRYVEVTGFPGTPTRESLQARFVRSAVESSGRFACSNPLLNQIHSNARWTLMSSFQGIPQDAAERDERVAWLGDTGFVGEDYIYNYDTASFWAKWLDDISDSQAPSGEVPVVSPSRHFYMDPAWHSTYPLFVWYLSQYYGDQRVLERHYDGMARLLAFLGEQARDHLLSAGIGDHMEPQPDGSCSQESVHTRAVLTSTAYYYFDAWIMAQAAEVLGKKEDAGRYSELAESIKVAFNREFFDESMNQYDTGSQTSNAMALYLRLVPEGREGAVLENLVADILVNHLGHLSTGIIGTNALEQALPEYGRADVMYAIATQTTYPSWGYQISKGATAVWETWDDSPRSSRNMKMFCSSEKFFYERLAGIALAAPGFKRTAISPEVVGDLTYATASLMTVRGLVEVRWERSAEAFDMRIIIPANTTARVSLPKLGRSEIAVTEGRIPVWQDGKFVPGVAGITTGAETEDRVVLDVASGSYSFRLSDPSGMVLVDYDH